MKVAVLSDIQANLPAMQRVCDHIVAWQPDKVIMNGDLVNRGPSSLECLLLFQQYREQQGWIPVRGNHEDYIRFCLANPPESERDAELRRFADWTAAQLGDAVALTDDWPDHYCFHAPGQPDSWVHVTHGSIESNRRGIMPNATDEELAARVPMGLSVFVTGHTHRPLILDYKGVMVVNVGSAGSPFDGDPRASYAQLTFDGVRWQAEIIRLEYDRDAADRAFFDSGFVTEGGTLARLIYHEWKNAIGFMPQWHMQYHQRVLAGEIHHDEAAERFLAAILE